MFSTPGSFNTHFSGGLSAYGTLAGWVRSPVGRQQLARRDPGGEMEDTLAQTLCSVIPIRRNRNQSGGGRTCSLGAAVGTQLSTLIWDFMKQQAAIGRRAAETC